MMVIIKSYTNFYTFEFISYAVGNQIALGPNANSLQRECDEFLLGTSKKS